MADLGGKSGHGTHPVWIDFGSHLQRRNKHGILENILHCRILDLKQGVAPLVAECLDPPLELVLPLQTQTYTNGT